MNQPNQPQTEGADIPAEAIAVDATMQNKVLALCEERLSARTAWDETPEALALRKVSSGLGWEQLPIPEAMWHVMEPPVALAAFAHLVAEVGLSIRVPGLVAVAFRYEAFVIASDVSPQADEAIRRRRAGGSVPRNEHIPGRVEQRIISALDMYGRQYMVAADRQDDGTAVLSASKALSGSERMTGRVPSALDALLEGLRPSPTSPGGTFAAG